MKTYATILFPTAIIACALLLACQKKEQPENPLAKYVAVTNTAGDVSNTVVKITSHVHDWSEWRDASTALHKQSNTNRFRWCKDKSCPIKGFEREKTVTNIIIPSAK